ncbi:MAG TPA: preprotein translocase subunit SecE [Oligoflexia bacterium]|nr:preprotein translocase subunit SecE [Oligoflexia bacterium]
MTGEQDSGSMGLLLSFAVFSPLLNFDGSFFVMAGGKPESSNPVARGISFFRESVDELKKVHAPTREETLRATIGVLVMVVIFAVFLGFTDWIVGLAMQKLFIASV